MGRQNVDGHTDISEFSPFLLAIFGIPIALVGEFAGQAFSERELILGCELVRCIYRKNGADARWA